MPTTPYLAIPYPNAGNDDNVPYDMQRLAERVEAVVWPMIPLDATSVELASGWVSDAAYYPALRVRTMGDGTALLQGPVINRSGSSLAISAGVAYTIATLPVGFRPALIVNVACTAGVDSVLGPGLMRINPSGVVQYVHYFATGTMATGGGVGNSIALPTTRFKLA